MPLDVLHRDPQHAVGLGAERVDVRGVRMVEPATRASPRAGTARRDWAPARPRARSTLITAPRPSCACSARNTSPDPPLPSRSTIANRPKVRPIKDGAVTWRSTGAEVSVDGSSAGGSTSVDDARPWPAHITCKVPHPAFSRSGPGLVLASPPMSTTSVVTRPRSLRSLRPRRSWRRPRWRQRQRGGSGGGNAAAATDGCSDAAKLVYVVDENNKFSQFDPATKTFMDLGTLPARRRRRDAVLDGRRSQRDRVGALQRRRAVPRRHRRRSRARKPTLGHAATASAVRHGLLDEHGGRHRRHAVRRRRRGRHATSTTSTLATLDTTSFTATTVGTVTGWPELTGNGNAELWGWFPRTRRHDHAARREDQQDHRRRAHDLQLPTLQGMPTAWAFAFWGGDYWIFLAKDTEIVDDRLSDRRHERRIKASTPTPTRTIVGAGVSTCAPVVIL